MKGISGGKEGKRQSDKATSSRIPFKYLWVHVGRRYKFNPFNYVSVFTFFFFFFKLIITFFISFIIVMSLENMLKLHNNAEGPSNQKPIV